MIEPFNPAVPEGELEALRLRLRATRWPEAETDPSQGLAIGELQELCAYWCDGYDWRRCEERLEQIGQFRTEIDGLDIHFLHAHSPRAGAFPLILTHGWPGSVIEFLDALQPLTEAGFHCVVPSLPGYGFSDKPGAPGWGVERIARAWATLMARLGYDRYGAQGNDWVTGREQRADEAGYSTQQRTRPQTIGYSLTDSPAGLAAWITEKVGDWTDPRSKITRDAMLDNIMLYWLPRAGASSARLYWESLSDVDRWLEGPLEKRDIVHAPAGCSIFPYELQRPSRVEAEQRFTDIHYWNEPELGGHFAAWEQPELFATEVTAFLSLVR